ncbi:selenoprotein N-like [Sarcophilus harrisii]|uniref:selenoprotein N-like n=1 Tax=Sarcophilus harrisii TaxID=9305 RepID=UPI001301AFE1|nr:selenoprotein N-like [Sarcophilus harrisii]
MRTTTPAPVRWCPSGPPAGRAEAPVMARHRRPGRSPPKPAAPPSSSLWSLALLLALLGVAATATTWGFAGYREAQTRAQREAVLKSLGTEGQFLFASLDTDRDLSISPEEFRPIAEKLREINRD